MADQEPIETEEVKVKGGKPWLMLSLVMLIVPVVTLGITEFVVIPRLQASMGVEPSGDGSQSSSKGSHGDGHASEESGGHGKSPTLGGAVNSYTFEDQVANLSGTLGTRFIKLSFEVRGPSDEVAAMIRVNKAIVSDAVILTLSTMSIQALEIPGGRNRLRSSLIESINESIGDDLIDELYFTDFIIQ